MYELTKVGLRLHCAVNRAMVVVAQASTVWLGGKTKVLSHSVGLEVGLGLGLGVGENVSPVSVGVVVLGATDGVW